MLGSPADGLALARAMLGGSAAVDINDKLTTAHLAAIPYELQPEAPVWQALQTENAAALKASRTAFSYVTLTSEAVLPIWLPVEAVGGRPAEGVRYEEAGMKSIASWVAGRA